MGRPRKRRSSIQPSPPVVKKRSAKRKLWKNEQMEAAMEAVSNGTVRSINMAAKVYAVPPSTLKDRMSGCVLHGKKPGPIPYLTPSEEEELELYLIQASDLGYGKTRRQVKRIVEKVVYEKSLLRECCITDGWWRRFRERHPKLSLRSGDATADVRMKALSRQNIEHYFNLLKEIMDENDFSNHPERIYNMDESGIPLDPRPPRVLTLKGKKKVRYRTSGKKNQITVIGCANATGQALPPFIIFDAQQLNSLWD